MRRLTNAAIANGVTSIGDNAFYECASLTSVMLPNSVVSIGGSAFSGTGLTSVTLPDSVTDIGSCAFTGCTVLTNISVDAHNPFYSSLNGVLFDDSQTMLIQYPGGLAGCCKTG